MEGALPKEYWYWECMCKSWSGDYKSEEWSWREVCLKNLLTCIVKGALNLWKFTDENCVVVQRCNMDPCEIWLVMFQKVFSCINLHLQWCNNLSYDKQDGYSIWWQGTSKKIYTIHSEWIRTEKGRVDGLDPNLLGWSTRYTTFLILLKQLLGCLFFYSKVLTSLTRMWCVLLLSHLKVLELYSSDHNTRSMYSSRSCTSEDIEILQQEIKI